MKVSLFIGALLPAIALNFGRIFGAIFMPAVSRSFGAKSGTITAPTGADANLKTLGDSTPVRDTLAGIVRSALGLAAALKLAILNFGVRKAVIVPYDTVVTSVSGATGMEYLGAFALDDPSKKSGSWSLNEGGGDGDITALLLAMVAEVKPSFTVESLTNKIDEMNDRLSEIRGEESEEAFVVIQDQGSQEIRVYLADTAVHAAGAHTAAVALTEDVQYVQTVDSGTSTQFGE